MATTDHLTRLPSELRQHIIGYLFPTHDPDIAFKIKDAGGKEGHMRAKSKAADHPLVFLAATCNSLRSEVAEFARRWMKKHSDIVKPRPFKGLVGQRTAADMLRGPAGLLTWTEKKCVFCGNKSTRRAILMNGFHCCNPCDKEQWPDKINKTAARDEYDLRDHHLFPFGSLPSTAKREPSKHSGGLPKPRYGTYKNCTIVTTMFLRSEVEKLAHLVHGDLEAHLAQRQADREARKERAKERAEKRKAKEEINAQLLPFQLMFSDHPVAQEARVRASEMQRQQDEALAAQEPPPADSSEFWETLFPGSMAEGGDVVGEPAGSGETVIFGAIYGGRERMMNEMWAF